MLYVGLHQVLCSSYDKLNLPRPPNLLEDARDYSADGCYEPMFTGASEFKFAYINMLQVCNSNYRCFKLCYYVHSLKVAIGEKEPRPGA